MSSVVDRPVNYRFSGHETFPCRYTWLPKAVQSLAQDPALFCNEDEAMVRLGVGKNMVRAIRFWADATGVSARGVGASTVSEFGSDLLGETGCDPFLEDARTLWLIHWKIATSFEPLFAWDYLLNSWHRPDFTRSEAVQFLAEEANRIGKKLSHVTGRYDNMPIEAVTSSKKTVNVDKYYNKERLRPLYTDFEMQPLFIMASD